MAEVLVGGFRFVVGRLEWGCLLVGSLLIGDGKCSGRGAVDDVL